MTISWHQPSLWISWKFKDQSLHYTFIISQRKPFSLLNKRYLLHYTFIITQRISYSLYINYQTKNILFIIPSFSHRGYFIHYTFIINQRIPSSLLHKGYRIDCTLIIKQRISCSCIYLHSHIEDTLFIIPSSLIPSFSYKGYLLYYTFIHSLVIRQRLPCSLYFHYHTKTTFFIIRQKTNESLNAKVIRLKSNIISPSQVQSTNSMAFS